VTSLDVESEFLKGLGKSCFVEESVGRVGESCLEEIFVDENVELVCFDYD